ncbi:hypothetical protein [Paracoccus sp. SCN 68-21]|uniref:hypothetical protein n=1 Tax=Paracoccus sp. SCN 68-21 TaxID=1660154 RepID=UPI0025809D16|nr:hypothetical protein [Paracoccus sp. SCN 68-21]
MRATFGLALSSGVALTFGLAAGRDLVAALGFAGDAVLASDVTTAGSASCAAAVRLARGFPVVADFARDFATFLPVAPGCLAMIRNPP